MPDQFGHQSTQEEQAVHVAGYQKRLAAGQPGAQFATLSSAFRANDAERAQAAKDAKKDTAQAEVPDWIVKQLPPTDPRAIALKQRVINGTE